MDLSNLIISEAVLKKLGNRAWVKKQLKLGKTVQNLLNFTPETLQLFSTAAFSLLEQKGLADSLNAFTFIVALNPKILTHWLGLGMTLQLSHKYEEALDAYEMAATLELENPYPYFYIAKCLFALHDRTSATEALQLAILYSSDNPEYFDLHAEAQAALKTIESF
jgi:type III secretion system low calcium response chaperone LcrH/SycD